MPSEDLISGAVWDDFCDALKAAGKVILRSEAPSDALHRAEGFRYLTRLLRIGLEMHLEFADPAFPGFFAPSHETGKIGADNPDNLYLMARISGQYDYVIEGHRGDVPYLSFGSQSGGYESNGKMEQTGFLDGNTLSIDADGHFTVVLSATSQPGNWLALSLESNAIIVRQTFLNRAAERPANLKIRRRTLDVDPPPLSAQQLVQGLQRSAAFVQGTATLFANWAQSYAPHSNQLPLSDQALCQSVGGDPNILYYHSAWQLAENEALIITLPSIPQCRFWNLQINNYWMESLDYRFHRICINQHSAKVNADGSVIIVLSATPSGHPNGLSTAGHLQGTMCLRWVGASHAVQPLCTRVLLSDWDLRHAV